jgi:hypothetical protein
MESAMNYTRILILLVIWILLPNCATPLPSAHNAEIDKLQSHVAVGATVREDIISILGKPDLARDTYILYLRREYAVIRTVGLFAIPRVVGRAYMNFYFEFDDFGTLKDYRMDKYDARLEPVK